jgi:uncharacterized RDD family membrane protein YckC
MAFCTNCGAQNQENTQFCTGCGSRMGAPAAVTPQPPQPTPSYPVAPPPPPAYPPPSYPVGAVPPPSGPNVPGMTFAQWPDRVVGYLIDSLLVGVVMGILWLVAGSLMAVAAGGFGSQSASNGICCVMLVLFPISALVVGIFNKVYLISNRGASIGQGIMKLKVVDVNGNLLSFGTAFIRLLAQIGLGLVPFGSLIDLLWPLWDDKRQTLHDKAVGSFVMKPL